MQVLAVVSFVAMVSGQSVAVRAGDVVEMPDGADWLRAGLATPVEVAEIESATVEPVGERADVRPQRKGKRHDA
jgi:hypothetical protein